MILFCLSAISFQTMSLRIRNSIVAETRIQQFWILDVLGKYFWNVIIYREREKNVHLISNGFWKSFNSNFYQKVRWIATTRFRFGCSRSKLLNSNTIAHHNNFSKAKKTRGSLVTIVTIFAFFAGYLDHGQLWKLRMKVLAPCFGMNKSCEFVWKYILVHTTTPIT